jgi:hypothetical protein
MKRVFWFAGILLLICINAQSQTRSKKTKAANQPKATSTNNRTINSVNSVNLNTTTNYPAKANTSTLSALKNNYEVSDPILTTLNARANGANIQFNNSGIIGMPKRAYGFANGHILLNTTGTVTSGTQTGSGTVGTGSSLATFGSVGAPMNVNGKSPYAGINMWGNARNMNITGRDSSVRLTPLKKQ